MRAPRICFVITEDWYFWSHRRRLAEDLVRRGCSVDIVTNFQQHRDRIEAIGIGTHSSGMQRRGRNPIGEARSVQRLVQLFRTIQPDVVHLVGMKPILYGSMASRISGVPATVCAIAGLGWLFTPGGIIKRGARAIVQTWFRLALSGQPRVGFLVQNSHHRAVLVQSKMAHPGQVSLVHGAGVDTSRFFYRDEPAGPPVVLTHGRMLWDKGIGELVEAARIVRRTHPESRFLLVGEPDPANPASIPEHQLHAWNAEGVIEWKGRRDDIPDQLANSHIACLPSYHEGFPLSLVEATSSGRPVVTTDIPGCRDVVEHEVTGLLVPTRDANALAKSIGRLLDDRDLRIQMGQAGRQRVLNRMSCQIVNDATFELYEKLLGNIPAGDDSLLPARRAA